VVLVSQPFLPIQGGARILRPPGLGVSDYLDLLLPAEPGLAARVVTHLFDWLQTTGGWDLLDLPNLPAESPTASLVCAEAARRGFRHFRVDTHRRPFITLNGSWEMYLTSRSRKLRYNLRSRRRQLASQGALGFQHYTTPEQIRCQLGRAIEIHARRWSGQRTSTTFSSSASARAFYFEAIERLAAIGVVDLSTVELDSDLLAFCVGFVHAGKLYYYMPGFDPEYARYAPSTILLAHLIEMAYAQGLREVDFMLGEEPYKEQWATDTRATCRLVVAAPGPRAAAALVILRGYLLLRERARQSPLAQRVRRYGLGELRTLLRLPSHRRQSGQ
jgi:CelD/BcsL family acetyltransferase involved in cellulose biosynthesis